MVEIWEAYPGTNPCQTSKSKFSLAYLDECYWTGDVYFEDDMKWKSENGRSHDIYFVDGIYCSSECCWRGDIYFEDGICWRSVNGWSDDIYLKIIFAEDAIVVQEAIFILEIDRPIKKTTHPSTQPNDSPKSLRGSILLKNERSWIHRFSNWG